MKTPLYSFVLESPLTKYREKHPDIPIDVGWGNGYVVLPENHPCHGEEYDNIFVTVHGGLTFAEPVEELDTKVWEPLKYCPYKNGWVIGFDTAHYQDTLESWPKQRVEEETELLKKQLEKFY